MSLVTRSIQECVGVKIWINGLLIQEKLLLKKKKNTELQLLYKTDKLKNLSREQYYCKLIIIVIIIKVERVKTLSIIRLKKSTVKCQKSKAFKLTSGSFVV